MTRTTTPIALALALALAGASSAALASCTTGRPPLSEGDGGVEILSLVLEPAEIELVSADGSTPTASFRAYATSVDGARVEIAPDRWALTEGDLLGAIDEHGTFTASGRAGGVATVVASAPGAITRVEARATVRVRLDVTLPLDPRVPPSVRDRFATLPEVDDPFHAATILYPLAGARMPNNVAPPDVQWEPLGGRGDGYRVTFTTPHATVRGFAYDSGPTFRSSWAIDRAAWRLVADSARGEEVSVAVDRLAAGGDEIVTGAPVTFALSEDGLFGTLYYWQVRTDPQASDVLRLDAATGARQSVFGSSGGGCVGCHALSQDGRSLAATLDSRAEAWVTAVVDTASASAPPPDLLAPLSPAYHFLAFSPDGSRILASRAEGGESSGATRIALLDGATGEELPATGLPAGDAGYPAWSPDGEWVAWMEGGGDGPRGTTSATRIAIARFAPGDDGGGDDALVDVRVLHDGRALEGELEGGVTDARPTWSPDGALVAFAHGTRSVSARDVALPAPLSALYLVPRDGTAAPIRLERGMGEAGPVDAFWPYFSPFATEERDGTRLFWLAFYSRQDYGNARAGTRGTGRRQLWVTAIDPARAARGDDPSSAPYWIGGQDAHADNVAALWAPTGCRGRGESCGASSECCSGNCMPADPSRPDELVCLPPTSCRRAGDSCEDASDCCAGLECNLGVCGYVPPI